MSKQGPPGLAVRFFRWYCDPRLEEQILGDLEEQFIEDCEAHGLVRARRRFVWNVLRFFRRGIVNPVRKTQKLNQYDMFKHHVTLALRGFKRFKTSFAINLLGLSTGLACTLLIYLWVHDEWSMDKFHENDDRLYQVMQNINLTGKVETIENTPALLGKALLEEFPAVENMVSVIPTTSYGIEGIIEYNGKQLKAMEQYSTPAFFEVFTYPLIIGSPSEVLTKKNSAVISEHFANSLFGEGVDPRGKEITWHNVGKKSNAIITGVFKSLPANSSKEFHVVFTLEAFLDQNPHIRDWENSDPNTFLLLTRGSSAAQLNDQIENFIATKHEGYQHRLLLQKYSDRYLYGKYKNGLPVPGRIQYIHLFSAIAVLILLIACINFMNLSTAKASRRIKEIGVKKSFGVTRRSLITQFFTETFLLTLISILGAYAMVWCALPWFNQLTAKQLTIAINPPLIIFSLLVLLFTSFVAGSYPALYLSSFQPIAILNGKLSTKIRDLWARKGLVIFQYTASALLITSVSVISSQIHYIQDKNLGFQKEQIIFFSTDGKLSEQSDLFLENLKQVPGVQSAAGFRHDLLGGMGTTTNLRWEGKTPEERIRFGTLEAGYGLIETFGIELSQGRTFSPQFGDDRSKIILNEKAIELIGLEDPVGKTIELWRSNREIIGVVKDFHFESLHEEIKPCFFLLSDKLSSIVIRISPENQIQTIKQIEEIYHAYNPGLNFNFNFFDQEYDTLYKNEQQVASLSTYFAGVAIVISCLGLFGLISFTTEKKQKEVGIRKVLGADTFSLVILLTGSFTKLVIASILISTPISFWLMKVWLDSFVYRIDLSVWFFVGSGMAALSIAIATMVTQTIKASLANPVESLRNE